MGKLWGKVLDFLERGGSGGNTDNVDHAMHSDGNATLLQGPSATYIVVRYERFLLIWWR